MEGFKQFLIIAFNDIRTYIALASLVFAYIAYRRHKRKRLAFEIIYNNPLFSVKRVIRDRIRIYLDDVQVEDVNLVVIRIYNPGNDAITAKDFESSIGVDFGGAAMILTVEILEDSPTDLLANVSYDDSSIQIDPLLLNEKDSVNLRVLVSKPQNAITVRGRIAGVRKIEDRTESGGRINTAMLAGNMLLVFIGGAIVLTALEILVRDHMKKLGVSPEILRYVIYTLTCLIGIGGFSFIRWYANRDL
jgi:hypothetical protein